MHAGSNKILLVMVTFRRNPDNTFDEKTILPLQLDFNRLNAILVNAGYTMVIKLHHALNNADLSIFPHCSNVVFLKNKDIQKLGLTPTSTMPYCDALISDYSSCSTDYLLLDRPIGYLIPDFESYKTEINGGFIFDDPLSLMAGDKFTNQEGLEKFIETLGDGQDAHKEERAKVCKLLNGDWPKDVCPEKAVLDFYCGQQALK